MSYVAPAVREKFESLSVNLKNVILERNVELYNIHDLINVLDTIVKEADEEQKH
jgi:alpha-L-arabinofuranosidase